MFHNISKIHLIIKWIFFAFTAVVFSQSKSIPNPTSDINFGLSIPLSAIENAVNSQLPNLLVEDDSYTNNDNDDLKTWVYRSGDIKVTPFNEYLMQVAIPLKIKGEKRLGAMGVYSEHEFSFSMTMYCQVSGDINSDGELVTQTKIERYEYQESPTLNVAGVKIPIGSVVEEELESNKNSYAQAIDDNIRQNIPLKSVLLKMLQYFTAPYRASDEYNAWVDFECKKMQFSPFSIKNGKLQTRINLVSYIKVYMSDEPMNKPPLKYLPFIESKYILPQYSEINSYISIPYDQATIQSQKTLVGETYSFQEDAYTIQLEDIQISGNPDEMQIELRTSGDYEGIITLNGKPHYVIESTKAILRNPKFKSKSKNLLYQTALWIKKGSIQRKIAEEYGVPLDEELDLMRNSLDEYLNTTYYNSVNLRGKTISLEIKEMDTSARGLLIFYQLRYQLEVELTELKSF